MMTDYIPGAQDESPDYTPSGPEYLPLVGTTGLDDGCSWPYDWGAR